MPRAPHPANTGEKIIEIRNVTVYRGDTRVFNGLSLDFRRGENSVILGPNGSGKSTLLKLLSREVYPVADHGSTVRLFGRERWNVWDLRAHLGIVSNDLQHEYAGYALGLNVVLSGLHSSIDVWPHEHFAPAEIARAGEIMDRLGVAELRERPFGAMSTGQQRRCLLGRALIKDPDTLILDEPTGGLDLTATFQYLEIIRRLMRDGKTVILVTHHIHEIPPEIGRVVLLKQGRVTADGDKERILTSAGLSELFGVRLRILRADGYYQVVPG